MQDEVITGQKSAADYHTEIFSDAAQQYPTQDTGPRPSFDPFRVASAS
jgi:hypothetical protein